MTERKRRRQTGGRRKKRAAREQGARKYRPYIERNIPYFEILNEEGLALIEKNADILLEEIGIEFRDFPKALDLFKNAGADVDDECVHFPPGFCREIIQSNAQENIYSTQGIQLIMLLLGGEEQFLFQLMGHHLLEI